MRTFPLPRVLASAIVAALAVGLFFALVPTTTKRHSLLANAIIGHPDLAGFKQKTQYSADVPVAQLPIPAMRASGVSEPEHTGAWGKEWFGTGHVTVDLAEIQVEITPNIDTAKVVASQVEADSLSTKSFAAEGRVLGKPISIAPLDGVSATYTVFPVNQPASTKGPATSSPIQHGTVIIFRVGRAVVLSTLVEGTLHDEVDALTIAKREAAQVAHVVPTLPALQYTHDPAVSTGLYIALAAALIVLSSFIPPGFVAAKERREAELAARAVRHRRVRGAKTLKRSRRRY